MFKNITLRNFKCFDKDQSFRLGRITLLAGFNGTGKSSVCQSLLLLAQSIDHNAHLVNLKANGAFVNLGLPSRLPSAGSDSPEFSIGYTIDEPSPSDVQWTFKAVQRSLRRTAQTKGLVVNGEDQMVEIRGFRRLLTGDAKQETGIRRLRVNNWQFMFPFLALRYVSADRVGPALFERRADLSLRNPLGAMGEHKLEVLRGCSARARREIDECLSYIMGRHVQIQVQEDGDDILSLWFIDRGVRVSAVNTGSGFTYVLAILISAVLEENCSIIVENPEAHLHQQAQSRLMAVLSRLAVENNTQFIIETHSENILNGLRLAVVRQDNELTKDDVAIHFFGLEARPEELVINELGQFPPRPDGFFTQEEQDLSEILSLGIFK